MSSSYPILNNRPIDQWKVTELKEELRKRRLTITGLKQDLINRLNESILQEESANCSKPVPAHQDTDSEGQTDPQDGDQIKEDPAEDIQTDPQDGDQIKEDPAEDIQTDPQDDHIEEYPAEDIQTDPQDDHIEEYPAEDIKNEGINNEGDSTITSNDKRESSADAVHAIDGHANELVSVTDRKDTHDGEVRLAVLTEIKVVDSCNLRTQLEETGHFSSDDQKDEEKEDEQSNERVEEIIEKDNEEDTEKHKDNEEDTEKHKDTELLAEDVNINKMEPNNQVPEVKPDLGFPVHCESISTDSVSINEKNELKDNLNADNLPIELEVVKPEIVDQSSSDLAPIDGDLHPGGNVEELGLKQGPSEGSSDVPNASYEDLGIKNDNVEGEYAEKLNLDRSSGDESMDEDVLDKPVESNVTLEAVEDRVDVEELSVEKPSQCVDNLTPKKDAVAADEKKLPVSEKRKHEDKESQGSSEPLKRQRRWSTDTLKVPERSLSNLTSIDTPTGLSQSTPKPIFKRSDSTLSADSQKERVVPPSPKPPTNSLRIDRFLRPFTLKAAQDMLSKTGKICSFWMDNIKTHCYVTYSSEEEAAETRNAVYNLQWPPNGGRLLIAEFVDPQEVKKRLEAPPESAAPISPAAVTPSSTQQNQTLQHPYPKQLHPPPTSQPSQPDQPQAKERLPPTPTPKKLEPPILTLDDLFMKTKFTPRIYYLPLSEEQVAAKKAAQVRNSKS